MRRPVIPPDRTTPHWQWDAMRPPRHRRGDATGVVRRIALSVLLGVLAPLMVAVPIVVASWDQGRRLPAMEPGATMSARPNGPGSPGALIDAHDCWTGAAPADVEIPGHVVVTLPGHLAATYGGRRLTGLALEQIFNHHEHGLTVHAFCR